MVAGFFYAPQMKFSLIFSLILILHVGSGAFVSM